MYGLTTRWDEQGHCDEVPPENALPVKLEIIARPCVAWRLRLITMSLCGTCCWFSGENLWWLRAVTAWGCGRRCTVCDMAGVTAESRSLAEAAMCSPRTFIMPGGGVTHDRGDLTMGFQLGVENLRACDLTKAFLMRCILQRRIDVRDRAGQHPKMALRAAGS